MAVVCSSDLIRPSLEVRASRYELSGLDRIMQLVPYQKRILFYNAAPTPWEEIIHLLKKSLSEVLVAFYPLAGRLRSGNGDEDPALELDCRQLPGVRFTSATTDSDLADAVEDFMPSEFSESLCEMGSSPEYPWTPDTPLMIIQVTRFACGGISIGFAYSHQLMDGPCSWWFMNSWAYLARTGEMVEVPDMVHGYIERDLSYKELEPLLKPPLQEPKPADEQKLGLRQFKFDRSAIEKLKSETNQELSRFVAVCAHLWVKAVAAKDLPESSSCRFMVLVDCRGRIEALSQEANYFGNAIWSTVATASSKELVSPQGIARAATLLHEAIAGFDSKTAENLFHARRRRPRPNAGSQSFTMISVESPRCTAYECDFGFGKPAGVTFGTNDLHDGQVYLFPSRDGDVLATLVLDTQSLSRLNLVPGERSHS